MKVINYDMVLEDPIIALRLRRFMRGRKTCDYTKIRQNVSGTGTMTDEQITRLANEAGLGTASDEDSDIPQSDR